MDINLRDNNNVTILDITGEIRRSDVTDMTLHQSVKDQLDDKAFLLSVYKKAEDQYTDFSDYLKLAKAGFENTEDKAFASSVYQKAAATNPDCGQLVALAVALAKDLGDIDAAIPVLKQAEGGTPVPQLCREHGIRSATFYKWRSKYGGMDVSMMARLKELEAENRRLKKMYADVQLQNDIIKEALEKKP